MLRHQHSLPRLLGPCGTPLRGKHETHGGRSVQYQAHSPIRIQWAKPGMVDHTNLVTGWLIWNILSEDVA